MMPAKGADNKDIEAAGLKLTSVPMMIDDLAHCALFTRFDERKRKLVRINPPEDLAKALLSRAGGRLPMLPRLSGVVCAPTLRPDGSVLHKPGYDPATRFYHMPASEVALLPALLGTPTRDDALAAADTLTALLSEFPFVQAPLFLLC
jgi:putative DNA primase/helicase